MTYRELDEASNRLAHLLVNSRCAARAVRGAAVAAVGRGGRGDAGGGENRGGLRADRPGDARGADRSSCWPMPRRSPRSPPRSWPIGWTGMICWSSTSMTPPSMIQPSTALPAPAPRRHRLHHLHLGHHRVRPKGVAIPHRNVIRLLEILDADMDLAGTGVDAVPFVGVRLLGLGDLGRAAATAAGWSWCPIRWSARRKTSTPCWSPNRSPS